MTAKRALALYKVPENLNTSWNNIRYMNHHETNQGTTAIAGTFSPPWRAVFVGQDARQGVLPPCCDTKWKGKPEKSKRIPIIRRVTHTHTHASPRGGKIVKLRATGGVRLGESTNLTIALSSNAKRLHSPKLQASSSPSSGKARNL